MDKSKVIQVHPNFILNLGLFHGAWSSIDLTIDCAVWKFLGIPVEQIHIITSGMMSGPKIRLLHGLVVRSDNPQKAAVIGALNRLQNDAKRAALTHSYVYSDDKTVTFLERPAGGQKPREHNFTLVEFQEHVQGLANAGRDLWLALGYTDQDLYSVINALRKQLKS